MTEWLHLIVSSISRSIEYEMKVDCSFVDRPYVPEHLNIDTAKDRKHDACLANIIDILWQDVQSTEFRLGDSGPACHPHDASTTKADCASI
jgi:hypothetical protein